MKDRFFKVIKDLIDTKSGETTILAVSGGVDSVVMAQMFHACQVPIIIAHCNFQLRGEDSDKDEEFVNNLGRKLNAEVRVKRFETESYAEENGLSIQMAARDLRYSWFRQLSRELNSPVAIAHNADDVVETILFNLSKGTGIAGLHGIAEKENQILRPLLWAKKEDILAYAQKMNLDWREDSSNQSERYMRNLVRKSVIPQFERINPSFTDSILKTSSRLHEVEKTFQHYVDSLELIIERGDHIEIDKKKLNELPGKSAVLYYLLSSYGFNFDQTDSIAKSLDRQGAMFYSDNWRINIDREFIFLNKNIEEVVDQPIFRNEKSFQLNNNHFKIEVIPKEDFKLDPDPLVANLDLDKLSFPLRIRNWQQGDRFRPLGMSGQKLVSDYLIDQKIPINFKKNQLVILTEENILWLVGHRIDDRYKITSKTKKIYRVEYAHK